MTQSNQLAADKFEESFLVGAYRFHIVGCRHPGSRADSNSMEINATEALDQLGKSFGFHEYGHARST